MSAKHLWALAMLALCSIACTITYPALPSPTPVPSVTPIPTIDPFERSDTFNNLSTAVANVNSLPDDVSAPGGFALVPQDNGTEFFAYAKAIMTGNVQRELTGQTLFPLVVSITLWITLIAIISSIRFIVNVAMFFTTIAIWIWNQILRLVGAFT